MTENPTRSLTKYDRVKAVMRSDEAVERFAEVLGNANARGYISSVLLAVAQNTALQECSPQSIMTSAMRAATLKLTVDPSLGQAYIVPFKGAATFVIGYKGLEQLALRTGKYRHINVATIFEGQTVVENQLKGIHSIQGLPETRVPIGYLLYFELRDGYAKTFYMTIEEIAEHAQRYSKSFGKPTSPWTTNFAEMCKKTVMRLGLIRYGYFDPNDSLAMATVDDQEPEAESIDAEWMERAVAAEEAKPAKTQAGILLDLGFEPEEEGAPEPDPEPVEEEQPPMSIADRRHAHWPVDAKVGWDMAITIVSKSDGEARYVDLPNDKLSFRFNSLKKSIERNGMTPEQHEEAKLRLDVIQIILDIDKRI